MKRKHLTKEERLDLYAKESLIFIENCQDCDKVTGTDYLKDTETCLACAVSEQFRKIGESLSNVKIDEAKRLHARATFGKRKLHNDLIPAIIEMKKTATLRDIAKHFDVSLSSLHGFLKRRGLTSVTN